MDPILLSILACPKCKGPLDLVARGEAEGLHCPACAVVFPVQDDIPVLLVEEAIPRPDWDAGKHAPSRTKG
jgi:uncharacterized protein YbaR (Trm112 family)